MKKKRQKKKKNKEKPFFVFSLLDEDPQVTQAGKITRSGAAAGMPNMVNGEL